MSAMTKQDRIIAAMQYIERMATQLAVENSGESATVATLSETQRQWLAGFLAGFAERMLVETAHILNPPRLPAPAYNHTRGDSRRYPCPECAAHPDHVPIGDNE